MQAAREASASLAASLGLTRTTRFVNVLDLGVETKRETGEPRARGYEIALELPLFDWGGARVARAEALYMQSLRQVADTAVRARSQARERYRAIAPPGPGAPLPRRRPAAQEADLARDPAAL
ncbi:hypothetical protein [Massilia sp. Se16.2.3]|uniref:hypothetical protein n=1 Tax=Massilia sp. Se16.2.3 TaxID=2709303 RepID=UPI001E3E4E73|nr:hypothetical protein [Massilia sp. Se16.2.3]